MILDSVFTYCRKYIDYIKVLVCLIFALNLLRLSYKWTNHNFIGGEDENLVLNLNIFLNDFFEIESEEDFVMDQAVFINISNDKELINVKDNFGIPIGNRAITDRQKLIALIEAMQDKQKIAFFDIFFDPAHESAHDSLLNSKLTASKKIIIPSIIRNDSLIEPKFQGLIGLSSYDKTLFSNKFVKYTYLQNDSIPSVALLMHHLINDETIEKKGNYYFTGDTLCLNSLIIDHPIKSIHKYDNDLNYVYSELGADILDVMTPDEIQALVAEKIVLVGDYDDADFHQTIYGSIPGVIINYNSFLALKQHKHLVQKSQIYFLFMVYFLISMSILFDWDLYIRQKINHKLRKFKIFNYLNSSALLFNNVFIAILRNYIEIGVLVSGLSLLFYYLYGQYIEILGTSFIIGSVIVIRNYFTEKHAH
ncbi:CHASE2 domain-containing protein [Arenibacter sp. F20364]|uniref:CHASE2 domain-containing protein n=1 Tax=Arenibacter sp. F20364 TaxID=2926415 RepID=UPI001FF5DD62|nr:CHASE2 domain-containing protein [Arenibacter sp. F20364]MCK0188916.1 CHASE2 domain-containing protein [Arenibacter sp. F20364]